VSTNAAQGDYEAVAYQAFSITRDSDPPPPPLRDWSPSEDVRAAEAELRRDRHLVTQDASRPWLWHFQPTTVDKVGQDTADLPVLEGYRLQRRCFYSFPSKRTDPAR
jgi:mediator of RNA polymerase II transcription subunit 13